MSGRAAMIKNWAGHFPAYAPDPDILFLVKPIGNDTIWVIFEWSGTYHGPKGPGAAILVASKFDLCGDSHDLASGEVVATDPDDLIGQSHLMSRRADLVITGLASAVVRQHQG